MIRRAVSPLLIVLGMALTAHFLALSWAEWVTCFEDQARQNSSAYREYIVDLLSRPGMALVTLGAPFLPFILVALFLRAPERLVWQWIGIGFTTAFLAIVMIDIPSGRPCPDEGQIAEYGVPELLLMVLGGGVGFAVCLVVTYIGSIRHARRKAS
jgi:hypothetical protein